MDEFVVNSKLREDLFALAETVGSVPNGVLLPAKRGYVVRSKDGAQHQPIYIGAELVPSVARDILMDQVPLSRHELETLAELPAGWGVHGSDRDGWQVVRDHAILPHRGYRLKDAVEWARMMERTARLEAALSDSVGGPTA